MGETLIVRAIVPEELKEQFEIWYQEEHLPEAHKAFGSYQAYRGWSSDNPEAHFAIYRFANVGAINEIAEDGILGNLVAKFDERWQGEVTRTRELVKDKQSLN
jgi:hypothetical protein